MTPRFRYPRFEENQVLSYQHLNELTDFLEGEDRLSRRALIGAGVANGLALESGSTTGLRLRRGVALTTDGSLCHLEQDLAFAAARVYHDPAGYAPFLGSGGAGATQIELWELLEVTPSDTTSVTALTGSGSVSFLADKAALLYLEVTTADLDTCIDNHCVNQGRERRGVWRVVLVKREALTAIRQQALGTAAPGPAWALDELRTERLGLQSADVLSHAALSTRGLDFVRQSRSRLLPAVQESVPLFASILGVSAQTTADALNALSAGFDAWLASMTSGNRVGWQHGMDHVRHLYRAWAEFVEAAFDFQSEAAPWREAFPRHVLLGVVPTARYGEPDFFRHYFVPSPALTEGGRDLELCRHRFLRLLTLFRSFGIPSSLGVRITPGAALDHLLDEQAVPFYYDPAALLGWWNADATRRNRGQLLPCYHREALVNDLAVRDPLRFPSDTWEFYRIEGHQGRACREVEQVLDDQRRRYHLAFQVVKVTFGPADAGTTNCLCELDEIKALHQVSAHEMRCHISRLLGFLGGLAKPATSGVAILDKAVLADGTIQLAFDVQKVNFFSFAATAPTGGPVSKQAQAATTADANVVAATMVMPAAAAGASVTSQVGDIRHVHLDNLTLSYPVISAAMYPSLTIEALVNGLVREVMGRLTEADGQLAVDLERFNSDQFKETMEAARSKGSDLADALRNLSTDVKPEALELRDRFHQELIIFLANCVPTRILQIVALYAAALERLRATPTLASFLAQHPGLEHLGGVPKGGTFVLVCGRPETTSEAATETPVGAVATATSGAGKRASGTLGAQGAIGSSGITAQTAAAGATAPARQTIADQLLLKAYGYYQPTASTNALVTKIVGNVNISSADRELLNNTYVPSPEISGPVVDLDSVFGRLRDFFGVGTAAEPDIVLADFCLPYLCCSECTRTTTVVLPPPPATLTLPASSYCTQDPGPHLFTVQPMGGVVTGPGVAKTRSNYTFQPSAVKAEEIVAGRVTFTYKLSDGTSANFSVEIAQLLTLKVAAGPPTTTGAGTSVTFSNDTLGDATFVWDFGDNSQTSNVHAPTHIYTSPGNYAVKVTATPTSGPCPAVTTTLQVLIPAQVPSLAPTIKVGDRFCANNSIPQPVTVSPPSGNLKAYRPDGSNAPEAVKSVDDGFRFIPSGVGSAGVVKLIYTAPDGQTVSGTTTLQKAPVLLVGSNTDKPVVGSAVSFYNNSTWDREAPTQLTFTWDFGDRSEPVDAATPSHIYQRAGDFTVKVTARQAPCADVETNFPLTVQPQPTAPSVRIVDPRNNTMVTTFCADDTQPYTIQVSPDGGSLVINKVTVDERTFVPKQYSGANAVSFEYSTLAGSACVSVELVAPPSAKIKVASSPQWDTAAQGWKVGFEPEEMDARNKCEWSFFDAAGGGLEISLEDKPSHIYQEQNRPHIVQFTVARGPCQASRIYQLTVYGQNEYTLIEVDQPNLEFDPGHLDTLLANGLVPEIVGGQNSRLVRNVSSLNARAAVAKTDPAAPAALDTPAVEDEIGSEVHPVFDEFRNVLIAQAGTLSDANRSLLWEFAQIPIAATLYLAGLRTQDLTAGGEIDQAFSLLKEILENLRRTAHGAALAFNEETTALLEATAVDATKPVLQELSRQTSTAFAPVRVRRAPAAKKAPTKPAKDPLKPAARRAPKKPRRQG